MKYEIKGDSLPVLCMNLEAGEEILCQQGGMSWMDPGIEMKTEGGGLGKMLGKMVTGESMFTNRYLAKAAGEIAFASSVPGSIRAIEIAPGKEIIAQKGAFLACTPGVTMSVHFQKKLGSGFFGGEGFIMQKFSGTGIVFLEVDGYACEYDLQPGQSKTIDTGYLVCMDSSCSMDVVTVKGIANALFGGEGFFNTVVSGPGHIIIQTMPKAQLAASIASMIPTSK
ncbi:MAG: TIGR00266 family protein [Lachnospiraceae bacterium]|nr:TIGR00266 family protein [Lachnospiraceae bacterium]